MTCEEAQSQYVEILEKWPGYTSTLFDVKVSWNNIFFSYKSFTEIGSSVRIYESSWQGCFVTLLWSFLLFKLQYFSSLKPGFLCVIVNNCLVCNNSLPVFLLVHQREFPTRIVAWCQSTWSCCLQKIRIESNYDLRIWIVRRSLFSSCAMCAVYIG